MATLARRLICYLLIAYSARAAVITGTVRDPDGRPVGGATVGIGANPGIKTREDGKFRLTVAAARQAVLSAESDGFTRVRRLVAIGSGDVTVDLAFAQAVPHHESVTVVADIPEGDILNPDPAGRVLIREEILDANPGRPGAPVSIPGLPVETASSGIKAPQYFAAGARRRFRLGMLQASVSKADARNVADGAPMPEAPRLIFDVLGVIERLPWHLQARGEYEEVGRKPLGGFVSVSVKEFRGAVTRPFLSGRLNAGVNFLLARGFTGQTTETLAAPGEANAFERIVGVRLRPYAALSFRYRF